jgi:hypothetical protein
MAQYSRIQKLAAGSGFTYGAAPKGVLVNSSSSLHALDKYGNGFTLEVHGSSAGGQIFPVRIQEVVTIVGDVYVLF